MYLVFLFWSPDFIIELGMVEGQTAVDSEGLEGLLVLLSNINN